MRFRGLGLGSGSGYWISPLSQVEAEVQKRRVKQAEVEENAAPWEKARKEGQG